METRYLFHILTIISFLLPGKLFAYLVDSNPYRHIERLDKDGKYQLEWLVDWENSRIKFNVTVRTRGYVGLGLSRKGKMTGADIVIGGVLPNGQPYFSDRHAVGNQLPVEDEIQDWVLHEARESNTHTFLSFSRPFETCDEDHDLPITGDVTALLWAFGEKDNEMEYHYQNRGVLYTYLLDPDLTPIALEKTKKLGIDGNNESLGDWKVWKIAHTLIMPQKETTYLCSVHKTPGNRKQHIVGFRSILPTDLERRHVHHFLLHRCIPPVGHDASRVFQYLLGHREECYILNEPMGLIPTHYCTEVVHVWAVGQLPNFLPDHVGIPFAPNEYFMIQMHYDNPDVNSGIQLNHALEIFYTDNLRKHDAAMLTLGELTTASTSIIGTISSNYGGSFLLHQRCGRFRQNRVNWCVPPNSLAHQIYGHCAAGCTKSMLPTGIRAFASNLHTHLAGRGVRLLHIRDNKELPWISYDDNYNFNYQQIRILREERLILPGDTLINRCIYENTDREGNVTVGGFSTRKEMCSGFIWYYDKIPDRAVCRGIIRSKDYQDFLQIYNTTWSNSRVEHAVTSPPQNAGLLVSEVANKIDWTLAKREKLQEYHRHLPQVSQCPSLIINEDESNNGGGGEGKERSWLNARITTPRPSLGPHRYGPPPPIRKVTTLPSLTSPRLSRPSIERSYAAGTDPWIENPDTEFISVYSENIVPYQPPSICTSSRMKEQQQ